MLPILISDEVNVNLLPHPLCEIQVTDYRQHDKKSGFALMKAINNLPPSSPLPDPLPEPPPVPVSYLVNLKEQIDKTESMDFQEQISLVYELKARFNEGRSPDEVYELLVSLKQRDDLLAKVATEIDGVLNSIKDSASNQHSRQKGGQTSEVKENFEGEREKLINDDQESTNLKTMYCPKCGKESSGNSKFCSSCGSVLSTAVTTVHTEHSKESDSSEQNKKIRRFTCLPEKCNQLIADVKSWLESENFNCQQVTTESEDILLQIAKKGTWRKFTGMSTALNIAFKQTGSTLTVEIGAGRWIDKAAVGTVSMFVLWPLAVTSGIGAWQQIKTPDKIFDFIGNKLVRK